MAGIDAINTLMKRFLVEPEAKGDKSQQGQGAAFLAFDISDFSKTGTVPNWNAGNVPMTGNQNA